MSSGRCPLVDVDGKTITESSQLWAGVNHFPVVACEAIFQFLPVGLLGLFLVRWVSSVNFMGNCSWNLFVSPQLLCAVCVVALQRQQLISRQTGLGILVILLLTYWLQVRYPSLVCRFESVLSLKFS